MKHKENHQSDLSVNSDDEQDRLHYQVKVINEKEEIKESKLNIFFYSLIIIFISLLFVFSGIMIDILILVIFFLIALIYIYFNKEL